MGLPPNPALPGGVLFDPVAPQQWEYVRAYFGPVHAQ
jgi:hypothetical protein